MSDSQNTSLNDNQSKTRRRNQPSNQRIKTRLRIQRKVPQSEQETSQRRFGQIGGDILPREASMPRLGVNTTHILNPRATMPRPGVIVQPAMSVNAPNDQYEVEANQVADAVMRMPSGDLSAWTRSAPTPPKLQLRCMACGPENKAQRSESGMAPEVTPDVENRISQMNGGGQPLPEETRSFFESRMGADFSGVRVHTDGNAAETSQAIQARAFTSGNNIAFNSGEYNPGTSAGKHLLAHELTHTVQQGAADQIQRKPPFTLIQRDIKGSGVVEHGTFNIEMTKEETPKGQKSGEKGTVEFTPNAKSPDTDGIRLIQVVKDLNLDTTPPSDYNWTGGESDRNSMMTSEESESYTTQEKDTITSIAQAKTQGQITAEELYEANKKLLKKASVADVNAEIPVGTTISIPTRQGGYFVDHLAAKFKATPRTAEGDSEVPPYYREYAPNALHSQDGHKKGEKDIQEASLWDFPGSGGSRRFTFETVARSEELGLDYGTIHWNFTIDTTGKIKDESYHVEDGTSGTFDAALVEFNTFYKNPHTVMKGETLWEISERYYGDPSRWREIYEANKTLIGSDPGLIQVGSKLRIPKISA